MTFASCLALSRHVPVSTLLRLAIKQSVIAKRPQILSFFSLCSTQFDFFPRVEKKYAHLVDGCMHIILTHGNRSTSIIY